jgi:transposase
MRWRREIVAYFATGLTNGRTEGFDNQAKVVKKRAYGDRSRLRLLNACA